MNSRGEIFDTTVVDLEEVQFNKPVVIGGFVGQTLTGFIAASYIIEKMGLHQIGHVRSQHIPPLAVFIGKKLRTPFRIYTNKNGTLIVMICEVPLDDEGLYEVSQAIMDWAMDKKPEDVVLLEGAPTGEIVEDRKVYCVADEDKLKQFTENGIEAAQSALITGVGGAVLNECLARKIHGTSLITPASMNIPDPGAVLSLIQTVNTVFKFNIDTAVLEDNVKEFHNQLNELMEQYKKVTQKQQKGPAETMYG